MPITTIIHLVSCWKASQKETKTHTTTSVMINVLELLQAKLSGVSIFYKILDPEYLLQLCFQFINGVYVLVYIEIRDQCECKGKQIYLQIQLEYEMQKQLN